jgi:hypothetical protein
LLAALQAYRRIFFAHPDENWPSIQPNVSLGQAASAAASCAIICVMIAAAAADAVHVSVLPSVCLVASMHAHSTSAVF